MFPGELIQVIVVDNNHYARAKIAARESGCPDKIHRPWVDITLEEMMAWACDKQPLRWLLSDFHRDRFLEILYNFHYPELEGSVDRLRKVFHLVQHLSQQYQRFYVPEKEIVCQYNHYMGGVDLSDMRIYFFQDKRRTKRWNVRSFSFYLGNLIQCLHCLSI